MLINAGTLLMRGCFLIGSINESMLLQAPPMRLNTEAYLSLFRLRACTTGGWVRS